MGQGDTVFEAGEVPSNLMLFLFCLTGNWVVVVFLRWIGLFFFFGVDQMPLKRSCSFFLNFGIGNCSLGQFPGGNHGRLVFFEFAFGI